MIQRLIILIFGTLVLSSLITPLLFSGLIMIWPGFSYPYSRVFDRVAMLVLFGFVVGFRRDFPLREAWQGLKEGSAKRRFFNLLFGIVLSGISGLVLLIFLERNGSLAWRGEGIPETLKILKIVGAALLVSVLEESFFRVILLKGVSRQFGMPFAVLLSCLLYAVVHFIAPVKSWSYSHYSVMVGFEYLAVIIERMLQPGVLEGMVGLFVVGLVLCITILRSGSLHLCIGLHAGWVVAIKFSQSLTELVAVPTVGAGARYFLVAQPITWGYVALLGFALFCVTASRKDGGNAT